MWMGSRYDTTVNIVTATGGAVALPLVYIHTRWEKKIYIYIYEVYIYIHTTPEENIYTRYIYILRIERIRFLRMGAMFTAWSNTMVEAHQLSIIAYSESLSELSGLGGSGLCLQTVFAQIGATRRRLELCQRTLQLGGKGLQG